MSTLLGVSLLFPMAFHAAPPAPLTDPVALVRQLGSDSYSERNAAEQTLLTLGNRAVLAVEDGSGDPDAEIRWRCLPILKKLRVNLRAHHLQALRLGRPDSGTPLWGHYQRVFGRQPEEIAFFADMYEKESDLFGDVNAALRRGDQKAASKLYQAQAKHLNRMFTTGLLARFLAREQAAGKQQVVPDVLSPEDHARLTATLLVGTLPPVTLDDEGWDALGLPLSSHRAFRRECAREDARGVLVRKLLERWCLTARSDTALYQALSHLLVHRMAGPSRELALRALATSKAPRTLAIAACVLGHHGRPEDIPRVLPLLKRTEELKPLRPMPPGPIPPSEVQVADVALDALVRLTGQDLMDYGPAWSLPLFVAQSGYRDGRGAPMLMSVEPRPLYRHPFDRQAAFRRWQEWAEKNPKLLGLRR